MRIFIVKCCAFLGTESTGLRALHPSNHLESWVVAVAFGLHLLANGVWDTVGAALDQ